MTWTYRIVSLVLAVALIAGISLGLRPQPLAEIDEWLGQYRALWQQRLDALHTEVARGKRDRRSTR